MKACKLFLEADIVGGADVAWTLLEIAMIAVFAF